MDKITCKTCPFFEPAPALQEAMKKQAKDAGIELADDAMPGVCFGAPPQIQMTPVRLSALAREMTLAPQPYRPNVVSVDRACPFHPDGPWRTGAKLGDLFADPFFSEGKPN